MQSRRDETIIAKIMAVYITLKGWQRIVNRDITKYNTTSFGIGATKNIIRSLVLLYSTSFTSRTTLVLLKLTIGFMPTFIRKSPEYSLSGSIHERVPG